jgi:hypothetical protein
MRDLLGRIFAAPFIVLVVVVATAFCIVERWCAPRRRK